MDGDPAWHPPRDAGANPAAGPLQLQASDRVLILAPHPDDETLAAGALIQMALEVGAALRVIVATDGDNNPWPQRWLERRWQLGPLARRRWGRRRRGEARQALQTLGVEPCDVIFLGWPDQGLTDLLLDDSIAQRRLLQEIDDFMPTCVVVPVLDDHHPDHSAVRVLLETAIAGTVHESCLRLGFVLHTHAVDLRCIELVPTALAQQRKLVALEAYGSQLSLSRRRMLAWAGRPERFSCTTMRGQNTGAMTTPHVFRMAAWCHPWRRYRLLMLLIGADGALRMALDVPAHGQERCEMVAGVPSASVRLCRQGATVSLHIDDPQQQLSHGFVKLERSGARLFIFDHDGWHDLCASPAQERVAQGIDGIGRAFGPG